MLSRTSITPTAALAALLALAACGDDATGTGGAGASGTGGVGTASGTGGDPTGGNDVGGRGGEGGEGGGSAPFVPAPIPEVPDEVPEPCQAAIDSVYEFQFLDGVCGDKRWPSDETRDFACPTNDSSATVELEGGGTVTYQPPGAAPIVDTTALSGLLPAGLRVTVILIRRVNGVPHYRYLSNGTHFETFQPWSSTKFLAAANAAARLRIASNYEVGLTGSVGSLMLGDLVTALVDYSYDPYSSNSIGRYFHDIGGRAAANAMIHEAWLGRPSVETFGGNYGEAAPALGYSFTDDGGASVSITPDGTSGPANHLSTFTTAEAIKRLVLHREDASGRLPGIQWKDIEVLLHGAEGSAKGPFGGLSADPAIYLQTGFDIDYLEARSHGRFRVYSKLGLGSSGQFLDTGYACFPVLDDEGEPVPGWGREFVISAMLDSGGANWKERDRVLATAYRTIVKRIIDGRI
jgi:hypothetical protein